MAHAMSSATPRFGVRAAGGQALVCSTASTRKRVSGKGGPAETALGGRADQASARATSWALRQGGTRARRETESKPWCSIRIPISA
jgi:hypothetical protein